MAILLDQDLLNDIRLDFNEQLLRLSTLMPPILARLKNPATYREDVDALFRIVHSLKPMSGYLSLAEPQQLFEQCETVLHILRTLGEPPTHGNYIKWLKLVAVQLEHWREEVEYGGGELSPVDPTIAERLQVRRADRHPKEVLKPLSLLVVSTNPAMRSNTQKATAPYFRHVYTASGLAEAEQAYFEHYPDIVFCDYRLDDGHTALDLHRHIDHGDEPLPYLILTGSGHRDMFRRIAHSGIPTLSRPLSLKKLLYELIDMGQLYFGSRRIRVHSEEIRQQIERLRPLPESIREVIRLCDDEESPLKELLAAVQKDPVLSTLVIREANSPIYNQRIRTVDRAVSFFGKRVVKALSLSLSSALIGPEGVECYGITPEQFQRVSNMRLALMTGWYAKVNPRDLGILASTALICNLGQLILGKKLHSLGGCNALRSLTSEHDRWDAEEQVMGTTTPEVTADILKFWNFDPLTVDAIRYSYAPEHAPKEAHRFALANHIVCRLIPEDATAFPSEVPEEITDLMNKEGLEVMLLKGALEKLAG